MKDVLRTIVVVLFGVALGLLIVVGMWAVLAILFQFVWNNLIVTETSWSTHSMSFTEAFAATMVVIFLRGITRIPSYLVQAASNKED